MRSRVPKHGTLHINYDTDLCHLSKFTALGSIVEDGKLPPRGVA